MTNSGELDRVADDGEAAAPWHGDVRLAVEGGDRQPQKHYRGREERERKMNKEEDGVGWGGGDEGNLVRSKYKLHKIGQVMAHI